MFTLRIKHSILCLAAVVGTSLPAFAAAQVAGDFDPGTGRAAAAGLDARDALPFTSTDYDAIDPRLPTLHLAGDSTVSTGNSTHRGWGAVLQDFFNRSKINLVNRAVGGRSLRTYTAEGRWDEIVRQLKRGDWVIIEFGHNDGGDPMRPGSRGDVPGIGDDTVTVTAADGRSETVHSFGWYLRKYIRDAKARGARPIVSTTTPRNYWDGATRTRVERGMGQMLNWAREVAKQEGVPLIDHSNLAADQLERIGFVGSQTFFPADHTHTGTAGAILNARTLIAGLKGLPGRPLSGYLNKAGQAIAAERPRSGWRTYSPPDQVDGNVVRNR